MSGPSSPRHSGPLRPGLVLRWRWWAVLFGLLLSLVGWWAARRPAEVRVEPIAGDRWRVEAPSTYHILLWSRGPEGVASIRIPARGGDTILAPHDMAGAQLLTVSPEPPRRDAVEGAFESGLLSGLPAHSAWLASPALPSR